MHQSLQNKSYPYNPFTYPMTAIGDSFTETPKYQVECPCGTTVRGNDEFYCPNCKRVFSLGVAYATNTLVSYHSYDELYEAFLVSPSENDLGYSKTALDNLLAAVTPETQLYSGRALVKQKKRSWAGKFGYTDLVTAIVVVTSVILLHTFHYF